MIPRAIKILGMIVGVHLTVVSLLYITGFRPYHIESAGMEPTIARNEFVIGQLSETYRQHVSRFDIVVYMPPNAPKERYAKRVVGLPGEHVMIDGRGIEIDGKLIDLPVMINRDGLGIQRADMTLPRDAVFVLGDNTLKSYDSRYTGPVPLGNVLGTILFKK